MEKTVDFTWSGQRGHATDDLLDRREAAYGVRFPERYREMVIEHDGASIMDRTDFDVVDPQRGPDVRGFGQLLSYDARFGAQSVHSVHLDHAPSGVVPVTMDGMGEYVSLDYRNGRGDPAVVIWRGPHDGGDGDGIIPVADDFSAFLSMLREPDD